MARTERLNIGVPVPPHTRPCIGPEDYTLVVHLAGHHEVWITRFRGPTAYTRACLHMERVAVRLAGHFDAQVWVENHRGQPVRRRVVGEGQPDLFADAPDPDAFGDHTTSMQEIDRRTRWG